MSPQESYLHLIRILHLAYSGERAAALAYRGHWKSVRDPEERKKIQKIEEEELHHRQLVGEILEALGEHPSRWKELKALSIGKTAGLLCHVTGWLAPMYGAGRLESMNIQEYETAARHAQNCGHKELVDCLLTMAEVEWDHELYFRTRAQSKLLWKLMPHWPVPLPRETIRERYKNYSESPNRAVVRVQAPWFIR